LSISKENIIKEDKDSYLRRRVLTAEGSRQTIRPLTRTLIKHVGYQPGYLFGR
jgi:hypothetical protein